MTEEELDEDSQNKVIDLDHEDNVVAAETYLKGLVGQVFKVPVSKKNTHVKWVVIDDSIVSSVPHTKTNIERVKDIDPSDLFWELFPSSLQKDLVTLNMIAKKSYDMKNRVARRNKRRLRHWKEVSIK